MYKRQAVVLADSLNRKIYRKKLAEKTKCSLDSMGLQHGFRAGAVLVVAGVMPIDLLANERKIVFQRKKEVDGVAASRDARSQIFKL